jgi:hypothetical protein
VHDEEFLRLRSGIGHAHRIAHRTSYLRRVPQERESVPNLSGACQLRWLERQSRDAITLLFCAKCWMTGSLRVCPLSSNSCTIPWQISRPEGGRRVWHGLCLWGTDNQARGVWLVRRVLRNTSSLEEAAFVLKINPSTLYLKRKRLGL